MLKFVTMFDYTGLWHLVVQDNTIIFAEFCIVGGVWISSCMADEPYGKDIYIWRGLTIIEEEL